MCCDAPSPPAVDPRQYASLDKQTEVSKEMLDHAKEMDKYNQERQAGIDVTNKQVMDKLLANQDKLDSRADEQYQYYLKNGRPFMDRVIKDANDFDSEAAMQEARDKAAADVEQAFASKRDSTLRSIQRMGVNPTNGRMMAAMGDMDAQAALAKVQAMTASGENRRASGIQLRQQAGNLINGMPAQSLATTGAGMGAGTSASGVGASGMSTSLASQGVFNSGMAGAGGMFGSVANGFGNIYSQKLAGANFEAANSTAAGLGQLAGLGMNAYSLYLSKRNSSLTG